MTDIVSVTAGFVRRELEGAEGGHDWWHTLRVWRLARHISETEPVNSVVVELGALLHDIADSKFHNGDEEIGAMRAREFLSSHAVDGQIIEHVAQIVRNVSWKGGKERQTFTSLELSVVQDADRLDALGAIGIGRTFSYGGYRGRELYNPDIRPDFGMSKEEYKKNTSPTINHFYEKLLLLRGAMNTQRGAEIADSRHRYMEDFIKRFMLEWDGVDA